MPLRLTFEPGDSDVDDQEPPQPVTSIPPLDVPFDAEGYAIVGRAECGRIAYVSGEHLEFHQKGDVVSVRRLGRSSTTIDTGEGPRPMAKSSDRSTGVEDGIRSARLQVGQALTIILEITGPTMRVAVSGEKGDTKTRVVDFPLGQARTAARLPEARLNQAVYDQLIAAMSGSAENLDIALQHAIGHLLKACGADRAAVILRDDEGACSVRGRSARTPEGEWDDEPVVSGSMVAQTFAQADTQGVQATGFYAGESANGGHGERRSATMEMSGVYTGLSVPLVQQEKGKARTLGVLYLARDQKAGVQEFTEADLQQLGALAPVVAMGIAAAEGADAKAEAKVADERFRQAAESIRGMLPEGPLRMQGASVEGLYRAAHEVGGDFYDYFRLPDGRVCVMIVDISGHDPGVAGLAVSLSNRARPLLESAGFSLSQTAIDINRWLCNGTSGRFASAVFLAYDEQTGQAEIVNAGHPHPLLCSEEGDISEIEDSSKGSTSHSYPFGIAMTFKNDPKDDSEQEKPLTYPSFKMQLPPGSALFLRTDGLDETDSVPENMDGEELDPFGLRRLQASLQRLRAGSPKQIQEGIFADVDAHRTSKHPDNPQFDDMTSVVLKVDPAAAQ